MKISTLNQTKYCLMLTLLFCHQITLAQTTKATRLDELFTKMYEANEFNGNILVAEKGQIIYKKSFGIANEETQTKLNTASIFDLASITKQFTATAIVLLQKEKKLAYNDLIVKHLPELATYKDITIKHLLTHTSGLPDFIALMSEAKIDKSTPATNEDVLKFFQKEKPKLDFKPGEGYEYSNTGYLLLTIIIERLSEKSYDEYLSAKIFKPLGMKNTFTHLMKAQRKDSANYALGYVYSSLLKKKIQPKELDKENINIFLNNTYGSGKLHANVDDLLKWDRALYTNKIINEDDKKLMFTPNKLNNQTETDYGFGWFIKQDSLTGKTVSHTGRWAGNLTLFERDIDADRTIILLQNNEIKSTENIIYISQTIRKILNNQPIEKPFSLPEETLKKYAGTYIYNDGKKANIYYELGKLWTNIDYQMKPISPTKFVVIGFRPEVTYEFILDENKEVAKVRIQQPQHNIDNIATKKG